MILIEEGLHKNQTYKGKEVLWVLLNCKAADQLATYYLQYKNAKAEDVQLHRHTTMLHIFRGHVSTANQWSFSHDSWSNHIQITSID